MADKVLFQSDDDLSEQNLQEVFARENMVDYVESGLQIQDSDVDSNNNTLDVPSGFCVIQNTNPSRDQVAFVFPDARSGLSLADNSGDNYVFVEYNPSQNDDVSITIKDTNSAPSNPSLLIAQVDGGAGTVTSLKNQEPVANFLETHTRTIGGDNHHYVEDYPGSTPDDRLTNALSAASNGDTIYLGAGSYTSNRTFSQKLRIEGSGGPKSTSSEIGGKWTFNNAIWIANINGSDGSIVFNESQCHAEKLNVGTFTITVKQSGCSIVSCNGVSVTFESGTSNGLVDSCVSTSVTDNGSNTIGDTT